MKKLAIIIIFLCLVLFIYEVPLKNYIKKGKSQDIIKTLKILENAGDAVETYIVEWGKIPAVKNYSELYKKIKELYDTEIPLKDSWGNSLIFKREGDYYKLISPGKDKKINTPDDIIFKNGDFEISPKNKNLGKIVKKYIEEGG